MGLTEEQKVIALESLFKEVLFSAEYNSLRDKTQVLNLGVEDKSQKLTTRGIHSEQVADNAGRLVEYSGGTREEIALARLCGISHDLGHTPMGHAGEAALNNVLKKHGYDKGFCHSRYGEKVFERILERHIDKLIEDAKNLSNTQAIIMEDQISYLKEQSEIVKRSICDHDVYYTNDIEYVRNEEERHAFTTKFSDAKTENRVENATRLADTISFMSSDMQDLMCGKFSDGATLISVDDAELFFAELKTEYPDDYNNFKVDEFLEAMSEGRGGVESYHEKICEEVVAHPTKEGRLETISDEYKQTREITMWKTEAEIYASVYAENGLSKRLDDEKRCLEKAVQAVEGYDELHAYDTLDGKDRSRLKKLCENLDSEENRTELHDFLRNYYEKNNIAGKMNAERSKLWNQNPWLATAFEIQDQKQYNELIYQNKAVVLLNDEDRLKESVKSIIEQDKSHIGDSIGELSKRNDEPRTKEAVERVFEESLKSESFGDKNVIEYTGVPKLDYAIQQVWEKTNQQLLLEEGRDRTYGESTLTKEESAASKDLPADKDVDSVSGKKEEEYKEEPGLHHSVHGEGTKTQLLSEIGRDRTDKGTISTRKESTTSHVFSPADKDVSSPGNTSTFDKMNQKVNQGKSRCASGKTGKEVVKNEARLSR